MVVIDLFSGAGGLTEGFMRENFQVISHVEKEKWACETLKTRICYHYLREKNDLKLYNDYLRQGFGYKRLNEAREIIFNKYPELREKIETEVLNKTFGNPETEVGATSIEEIISLIEASMKVNKVENVSVIIGGPPCQAYSLIGRSRMKDKVKGDRRNFLFKYYKAIVKHFKPELFVFENVPGILTAHNGLIFSEIQREFAEVGYKIKSGPSQIHKENVLNSADFGVYQNRKRMILFGVKEDSDINYPNFAEQTRFLEEKINTKNAISDLPKLTPGQGEDEKLTSYTITDNRKLSKYQKLMREDSIGVLNHKAREHKERDRKIYMEAILLKKKGEQLCYKNLPEEMKTHKNQKGFHDRYKVHWWDNRPHTIVAHIAKDGHYNIHPDMLQCRSLTVREAARIQSFPDDFKFEGPRTSQYTQVGNAVPPIMGQSIAKTIKKILIEISKK